MVDPANPPTLPEASNSDLQEFLMFSIAVAGKNATVTANAVDKLLGFIGGGSGGVLPLRAVHLVGTLSTSSDGETPATWLASRCKLAGMGCYNQRARSFIELANAVYGERRLGIRTCSPAELEEIYGIGKKTSRFFVVYSRPWMDNELAILDTHILSWMRSVGLSAPYQTPTGRFYDELEQQFIKEATSRGVTAKELDKSIWISRRVG